MKRSIKWLLFALFLKAGVMFPQAPLWQWVDDLGTTNNEVAWDVHHDKSSGNIYACGSFDGSLSGIFGVLFGYGGGKDGFVVKYDQAGNILNAFRIGGSGDDEVKSVGTDPSGNLYITGYFDGPVDFDPSLLSSFILTSAGSPTRDAFLAKYSASGAFLWAIKIGNPGPFEEGSRIFVDASAVYITGSYESSAIFRSTNSTTMTTVATQSLSNFFGAKYDHSGVVQWVVSAGGSGADKGTNVKADNNRVYFIGNYFDDVVVYNSSGVSSATVAAQTNNKSNIMVLAFTQAGALSWNTNACSADDDLGYGLALDNDNVIICGAFKTNSLCLPYPSPTFTMANAGGQDIFLAAITKTTGVYNWISQSTGSGSGDEVATAVEKTAAGDIIITGSFKTSLNYTLFGGPVVVSSAGNEDVFVTAFNSTGNFLWTTDGGGGNVDIPYGLSSNTNNAVFVAGEYASGAVFTAISLLNVAGRNVFVGKTGCETVNNNLVSSSQTVCTGSAPVTFSGTLPTGGAGSYSYQWQQSSNNSTWTAAPGTNTNLNYASPTTTALVYYRRVLNSGVSCMYPSNTLTITINNLPDLSVAGTSQSVCSTTATISANSPTSGTGAWSVVTGTASITTSSSFSTEVTGLGVGLNRFVWTITNGVCPPSASTITITRFALPSISNAGTNQTICANSFTLGANAPVTGNGLWTILSGGSSLSAVANPSAVANNIGFGPNDYVWTITNGVCPPSQATVTIFRDQIPALAVAGINQSVCATTATLAAITPSVGTGTWSLITGPSVITSVNSVTTGVTGLGVGNNVFQWKVINGVCPPSTSTVLIKRDALPTISNAGTNVSVCVAGTTLGANPPVIGIGSWSVLAGGASVSAPLNPSTTVTSLSVGANDFQWSIANGVCPVSTSTVTVFRDALPSNAVAGTSQTVCSASTTLSAQVPITGVGTWSVITGPSVLQNSTLANSSVSNLSIGLNGFEWKVVNGVCPPSTSTVLVKRDAQPTISNAGTNVTVCVAGTTLGANSPVTGIGSWSVLSGSASVPAPLNPSTSVTGLSIGANEFQWSISNGVCPVSTSTVTLFRDAFPSNAVAGTSQTVCSASTTLSAQVPAIGVGTWSVITGQSLVQNSSLANSAVNNLSAGSNEFEWKVINGVCPPSTSTTTVIRDLPPSPAVTGPQQTVCAVSATLNAQAPATGTGSWNVLSGPAIISSVANPNSEVGNLQVGDNDFGWTVINGVCPPSTATLVIKRDALPDVSLAGVNQTVCGSGATLSANDPSVGAGSWAVMQGGGTLLSPLVYSTSISGLSAGENKFVWKIENGVCPQSTDTIVVFSFEFPSVSNAGPDQQICSNNATMNASKPMVGEGVWNKIQSGGQVQDPVLENTMIENMGYGLNIFLWSVNNGICPPSHDTVRVMVDEPPGKANAGADQHFCGQSQQLSAITPVTGAGQWSSLTPGPVINSINSSSTSVNNLIEGENAFVWTVINGVCPPSFDTLHLTINLPPQPAFAGSDRTVCSSVFSLKGEDAIRGTGSWSIVKGNAVIKETGNAKSAVQLLNDSVVLRWVVVNGVCPSTNDEIVIVRDTLMPVAVAGDDIITEKVEIRLSATPDPKYPGAWTVVEGSSQLSDPSDAGSKVTNLSVGNNRFQWQVFKGECAAATDEVIVYLKEFKIPNGFSPNDDGYNDRFHIDGLENFEAVKLQVFNRWGTLLFEDHNYRNNWNGSNQQGENMVDDTYYYVLEVPGKGNYTGFIIIKRSR